MPCGWEGNRRSGVALAMRHRLHCFIHCSRSKEREMAHYLVDSCHVALSLISECFLLFKCYVVYVDTHYVTCLFIFLTLTHVFESSPSQNRSRHLYAIFSTYFTCRCGSVTVSTLEFDIYICYINFLFSHVTVSFYFSSMAKSRFVNSCTNKRIWMSNLILI